MEEYTVHNCGGDYVYCNGLCKGCEKNKVRASDATFTMQLNSPITDEQWNAITDAELEHSNEIEFTTPSGKKVVFRKVREGRNKNVNFD